VRLTNGMPENGVQQLYLARCPHCGIAKPNLNVAWQAVTKGSDETGGEFHWASFVCSTCGSVTTARGAWRHMIDPHSPIQTYPTQREAHEDLPPQARRYLDQAFQTLAAPDAAAMVAGSAVDAMLKHLGYESGSVYARIDQAKSDGLLTSGMAEWAHSVRLGANRPRHADKDAPHVSPAEARQSVDFAEALGNFLFVLTARVNRGIEEATLEG